MLVKLRYRMEIIKKLKPFSFGVKKYFALIAIVSCISMLISFATPVFYKLFVDEVIVSRNITVMTQVITGYLVLFAIATGLSYLRVFARTQ